MKELIRKILKEEINDKTLIKIHSMIESGKIKEPYTKSLGLLGFDEDEIKEILQPLLNDFLKNIQPPYYKGLKRYGLSNDQIEVLLPKIFKKKNVKWNKFSGWMLDVLDGRGNHIYKEDINGDWVEEKYDKKDRVIYHNKFDGSWYKLEYGKDNKIIYHENSNGVLIDKR